MSPPGEPHELDSSGEAPDFMLDPEDEVIDLDDPGPAEPPLPYVFPTWVDGSTEGGEVRS